MQKVFSPSTQQVFMIGHHPVIPEDARPISNEDEHQFIGNCPIGFVVDVGPDGQWRHTPVSEPLPTVDALCQRIDTAADLARLAVAGDPLRAVEYDRARIEAEQYAAAGYQGEVPPMVAAWAINGRTHQQAADNILAEAALYTAALVQLREVRLAAKEQVRALMADGEVEQAKQVAEQAVAVIQAAVAGVGNAGG